MECFPPCPACTGLCKVKVATRRDTTPRRAPEKKGYTDLACGHTVPASMVYLSILGSTLGAMPWCDRCADFQKIKPARKSRKKAGTNDEPLF